MTRTYLKPKLQRRKCGQTERFAHKAQEKLCSHSTQLIEDSAFSNAESAACNSRIIEDARQCTAMRGARLCTAPSRHNPECLTHERMFEEAKDVERKTHSMNKGMKKISQQDVKKVVGMRVQHRGYQSQ